MFHSTVHPRGGDGAIVVRLQPLPELLQGARLGQGGLGRRTGKGGCRPGDVGRCPLQSAPFVDLLVSTLLLLDMVDKAYAQVHQHYTNGVLMGKRVVGLYFIANW